MKRQTSLLVIALMALVALGRAGEPETLEQIVARAKTAKPGDQATLYVQAAQLQLKAADQLYTDGQVGKAEAALNDVVDYCGSAAQAALQARKKLTNTEIAIRKMSQKLREIKRTLSFEDQPPAEAAAEKLEKTRTDMLSAMFQKD